MATTRSTGFVVTAAIWNAVLSGLSDAGNVFTGAINATTGAFASAVTMASTLIVTGATTLSNTLAVAGAATFGSTIKEYGRSVAQGVEIPVAYGPANFNANAGQFLVEAGDMGVNSYTLIGKQMFWTIQVATASLTSNPTSLVFTIPGGHTAAASTATAVGFFTDGTNTGGATAVASGATVTVTRNGTFAANTNGTSVYFSVRIPIV